MVGLDSESVDPAEDSDSGVSERFEGGEFGLGMMRRGKEGIVKK